MYVNLNKNLINFRTEMIYCNAFILGAPATTGAAEFAEQADQLPE